MLQKVEQIVREELTKRGAYEVLLPFVQPADLWKESERWGAMGPELLRLKDRHENDYCLSPTHEEVITDIFRKSISSYRQLPCNFFQVTTKFRDEIRPRFGVLRAREFIMKDGYSFHVDQESFDVTYQAMYDSYSAILERLGLKYRAVEADPGLIGDGDSHEFHVLAQNGEDALAFSENSSYAANVERAEAIVQGNRPEPSGQMKEIATPNVASIESLSEFLKVSQSETVKTLVVRGEESLVALALRGDQELNELKAARLPGVKKPLEFANDEEIFNATGCGSGSIGPVNLNIPVYVDRGASVLGDFVCGANKNGFHLTGVNWERDAACDEVVDIRKVNEGDPAPDGSGPLSIVRGIEIGHIFQLGIKYSKSMNASILDEYGNKVFPLMGCYGVGITRLAAAIVEQCHDDKGITWPIQAAPAQVHLVSVNSSRSANVLETAEKIYEDCTNAGVDVLYDDRHERPGVKFADADLIGIPHRITVGDRALSQGCIEYQYQRESSELIPQEQVLSLIIGD